MKWSHEEELLLRLLLPTNSYQEISEEFNRRVAAGIPGHTVERTPDAVRRKCTRDRLTPENCANTGTPYEDHWERIKDLNRQFKLDHIVNNTGLIPEGTPLRKILCLSDIHFPFAREDAIAEAIDLHSDADIVVLNGDILDGYAFSVFPKSKKIATLIEYNSAFLFVKMLRERFPLVVLVSGNHDARPAKALGRANFKSDTSQILRPDLIARIANGEELDKFGVLVKKHDFDNVVYQASESWWVQLGRTIFCHPHGWGGSGPGATVVRLDRIFRDRFGSDAYDSIVCGHTHRIYKGVWQNRLLIEQGSLSARMGYEYQANIKMSHSMNGYCVIYQDQHGNTDFNKSGPVYLGSELPPKKPVL